MSNRLLAVLVLPALALGLMNWTPPAHAAQVTVGVTVGTRPPPLRHEVVPALRPGYVWTGGYWRWNGHRHVWVAGHYVPARAGFVYVGPHWVATGHGWRFEAGHWRARR